MHVFAAAELERLFVLLRADGRRVLGPLVRDGAIVQGELQAARELPIGWRDRQAPGRYRLERRDDAAYFGFVVGPQGPRGHLTPAREPLVQIRRRAGSLAITPAEPPREPVALLGVRACELAAMRMQARVWTQGEHRDPRVAARLDDALVIAVECTEPGALCFCASMQTGPQITDAAGFDLRLTERIEPDGEHVFLVAAGSARGEALLERWAADAGARPAAPALHDWRRDALAAAEAAMGRHVDAAGLPELLFASLDHPRWAALEQRCLACGNCTQVCPTCFCHRVEEVATLDDTMARERVWDSCFTDEHSRIHGGHFRPRIGQRYRQWLTHKFGGWVAQFGASGCVGCGRCIAWCPVGIDVSEELAALREGPRGELALPLAAREAPARVHEHDPMQPRVALVRARVREGSLADVVTLALAAAPGEPDYVVGPGEFAMLGVPGVGEVPISSSGSDRGRVLHTLRAVGATTAALARLDVGDALTVRGPFGRGWPLDVLRGRELVILAGGLGLAPLRGAIRAALAEPEHYPFVRILYGARSPSEILYDDELLAWQREHRHCKVHVTVDRVGAGKPSARAWTGHVGVVTTLMRRKRLPTHAAYLVCGPETMMRFVLRELAKVGVPDEHVWVSMERNMKCAAGLCGRCQLGPHFVCQDGPVFRRDRLGALLGHEGF